MFLVDTIESKVLVQELKIIKIVTLKKQKDDKFKEKGLTEPSRLLLLWRRKAVHAHLVETIISKKKQEVNCKFKRNHETAF